MQTRTSLDQYSTAARLIIARALPAREILFMKTDSNTYTIQSNIYIVIFKRHVLKSANVRLNYLRKRPE